MFKKLSSLTVIVCFFLTSLGPLPKAHADAVLDLPAPGTMINLSPAYEPVMIKGLTVHKDNPFLFDFIVDVGQDHMSGEPLKKEGEKLIKYFLASLAIPDKDVWVNLSPYEKNRMIPDALGQTDMGRDLLEQDYILKQITASLIYPEKQLGKEFWNRVYAKAQEQYGTTQIPVNTFNKVWIMADRAEVFEHNQTAFVVDSHLKVMLEEDYLALQKHNNPGMSFPNASVGNPNTTHSISSQIIKQIILPELEKEVNTGKNFANLRQIFNSIILSSWYKRNLKQALLNQVYADKSKVKGVIASGAKQSQEEIYEQYLKAYKKGVFNYIKEDINAANGETMPRKYFSGGMEEGKASPEKLDVTTDLAMGARKMAQGNWYGEMDFATLASTTKITSDAAMTAMQMVTSFGTHKDKFLSGKLTETHVLDAYINGGMAYDYETDGANAFLYIRELKQQGYIFLINQSDIVSLDKQSHSGLTVILFNARTGKLSKPESVLRQVDPTATLHIFKNKKKSIVYLVYVPGTASVLLSGSRQAGKDDNGGAGILVKRPQPKPTLSGGTAVAIPKSESKESVTAINPSNAAMLVEKDLINGGKANLLTVEIVKMFLNSILAREQGENNDGQLLINRLYRMATEENYQPPDNLLIYFAYQKSDVYKNVYPLFIMEKNPIFKNGKWLTKEWKMSEEEKNIIKSAVRGQFGTYTIGPAFKDGSDAAMMSDKLSSLLQLFRRVTHNNRNVRIETLLVAARYKDALQQWSAYITEHPVREPGSEEERIDVELQSFVKSERSRLATAMEKGGYFPKEIDQFMINEARQVLGDSLQYKNEYDQIGRLSGYYKGRVRDYLRQGMELGDRVARSNFPGSPALRVRDTVHTAEQAAAKAKEFVEKAKDDFFFPDLSNPNMNDQQKRFISVRLGVSSSDAEQIFPKVIFINDKQYHDATGHTRYAISNRGDAAMTVNPEASLALALREKELASQNSSDELVGILGQVGNVDYLSIANAIRAGRFQDALNLVSRALDAVQLRMQNQRISSLQAEWLNIFVQLEQKLRGLVKEQNRSKLEHKASTSAAMAATGRSFDQIAEEARLSFERRAQEASISNEKNEQKAKQLFEDHAEKGRQILDGQSNPKDRAAVATVSKTNAFPGGIDLNTSNGMQWKVSKDGNGVEMTVDPAMIESIRHMGIDSLSPVIFKITPIASIWPLVGLQAPA